MGIVGVYTLAAGEVGMMAGWHRGVSAGNS